MSSSDSASSSRRRWIVRVGVLTAVLCLAYTGAWFYFADRLQEAFAAAVAEMGREGVRLECVDTSPSGFPVRLGLFCQDAAYENPQSGLTAAASAFRYSVALFQPADVQGDIQGPALVTLSPFPTVEANWEGLRAALRRGAALPESVIVTAHGLAGAIQGGAAPAVAMALAELEARPVGHDLDVAARFDGLALDSALLGGRTLPPLDGKAEVRVDDGVRLVLNPRRSLRGRSVTIRNFSLSAGEDAKITLSGRIWVDDVGLVNGRLTVLVHDPQAVAHVLSKAFPTAREAIESGSRAIAALGNQSMLHVRVMDGEAYMGFIPLGRIPPL